MPNFASALKGEVVRLARKEVRGEIASLKKSVATQRSEIASLKKQLHEVSASLKKLAKAAPPKPRVADVEEGTTLRFSAKGLKSHRQKLGLSAKDYGLLVGASGLSIYKWEDGKAKPQAKSLALLVAARGMSKRQAAERLQQLGA